MRDLSDLAPANARQKLTALALTIFVLGLSGNNVSAQNANAHETSNSELNQEQAMARPGKTLYPNVAKPDYVVNDLSELGKMLGRLEIED